MPKSIMHDVAAARKVVTPITGEELMSIIDDDNVLVVDVRDAAEVVDTGKIPGALNISRGMLEFCADDSTPMHVKAFERDKTIVVYCATGGRAALSGKALLDLGYTKVRNLGSLKAWVEAGGSVETEE